MIPRLVAEPLWGSSEAHPAGWTLNVGSIRYTLWAPPLDGRDKWVAAFDATSIFPADIRAAFLRAIAASGMPAGLT